MKNWMKIIEVGSKTKNSNFDLIKNYDLKIFSINGTYYFIWIMSKNLYIGYIK